MHVIATPHLDLGFFGIGGEAAAEADAAEISQEVSPFSSRKTLSEGALLFKNIDSFKLL